MISEDWPLYVLLLVVGLVLIEVFKKRIALRQMPPNAAMGPVNHYRVLLIVVTVALLIVDYWQPLHVLRALGLKS